jgi:mannitol-1-phosphate 5-dehydrogenase
MHALIFGAGNIGRSFIGQLFATAGYAVTFVDVNETLVAELNRQGRYRLEVRGSEPRDIWVEGVSAVDGRDRDRVAEALATTDIAATAVGSGALRHVFPVLAEGLVRRRAAGRGALDILICENLRQAADAFRVGLREHLPADFPLDEFVGLVETSVGKMVPILPEAVKQQDPLVVWAEAYNTLPVDARAFRNPIPAVPGLDPKQNMTAYVERKSFIHNLGHAACAYLGHLVDPSAEYLWQVVERPEVRAAAKRAMLESGRALIRRFPDEFTEANQEEHIEDLLTRFANRALGDTIYRVGRDLPRKLSRDDRLIGALRMDRAQGLPAPATTLACAAAFFFRATDEQGAPFPADAQFQRDLATHGLDWALTEVCGLDAEQEAALRADLTRGYEYLAARPADWLTAGLA